MKLGNFVGAAVITMLTLAVPLGFVALAVWWLEDRFGSISAVATVGGVVGVVIFAAGALMTSRMHKHTLQNAADFVDSIAQTQQSQAGVWREYARGEREQFSARAKLEVIDAQRVQRLADQQTRMLMSAQRQEQQPQKPAALWAMADDDAESFQHYQ